MSVSNSFSPNTKIESAKVNENFTEVLRVTNRQDDTTDSTPTNQRMCFGWGALQGNTGTANVWETVTFPITFDTAPVILISCIGYSGSAPTAITDCSSAAGLEVARATSITVANFRANIQRADGSNFSDGNYFYYTWIAIATST